MRREWPMRAEIWLVAVPDKTKRRPCVVVSANWLNQHALDVTVVPITIVARDSFPTRVLLAGGEGGLQMDSWAKCDQATTVIKSRLEGGSFGQLSQARMEVIADAMRLALDL